MNAQNSGDNGCGKSSLFRVLCGLWPQVSGTLHCPKEKDIYFLSQVNFVPVGSLREIIVYPQSVEEFIAAGGTDTDLLQILEWSHLQGFKCDNVIVSLDDVLEWETALSPGQKQRMAFARLLYARPKFAILDECTNGVAPAIEADLYSRLHKLGMAVFSISHKNDLKRFHDYELHFHADAEGGWDWIDLAMGKGISASSPSSTGFVHMGRVGSQKDSSKDAGGVGESSTTSGCNSS